MSTTTSQFTFTDDGFHAFLESRIEPDWLRQRRVDAWQIFKRLSWPNQKDEEWMRTDIRLFNLNRFDLRPCNEEISIEALLSQGVDLAGQTSSVNGICFGSQVDPLLRSQGGLFGSLEQFVDERSELVEKFLLNRVLQPNIDKFAALHGAFWTAGTLLYVPRGVVIEKPLHAIAQMSDGGCDLSHVLVILEDGAEATLLTELKSPTEHANGFHCGAIEILVGANAHLRFVNLQDWGQGVWHFGHQKALVDRDGSIQWTVGALGSRLSKINQHVALVGEGASSQVNGVMFTENKQHLSYHTLQHHQAPNSTSDFLYKTALQDASRTVWRGMIKVDKNAQKTDGYQRNDNLLLSSRSRADSIPGLEIEADDVRCTHGSTSGRVDEELIFYAQARGFTRREAIQMIVTGFFQQVFDRISIESVRDALSAAIASRVREYH
ncbi:MAG TPA: Fe-S cluster assembly protein SufD [Pirellulaceae bacterium]|nr:Fe-S cluster assembly protein SufD [Pirellulaceae bacterium]